MNCRTVVSNEVKMFWRICQDFRNGNSQIVVEAIDEMEVLHDMTDSESLKVKCQKMLAVMRARCSGIEWRAQA